MYISETFTKQKLIVKSLPIPQEIDIPIEATERYKGFKSNHDLIPINDPGVHNPIANALVDFYDSTMKRTWVLLQKEELLRVKKQVPKIREDAGFIKQTGG